MKSEIRPSPDIIIGKLKSPEIEWHIKSEAETQTEAAFSMRAHAGNPPIRLKNFPDYFVWIVHPNEVRDRKT